jgi:hypothetical protein
LPRRPRGGGPGGKAFLLARTLGKMHRRGTMKRRTETHSSHVKRMMEISQAERVGEDRIVPEIYMYCIVIVAHVMISKSYLRGG